MNTNLSVAIRAAIHAGQEILTIYKTDFQVEHKSDDSPLTLADQKANSCINSYL